MPLAPLRIATDGGPSSHVLDLRAAAKPARSGKFFTLPEKFEALRGHNFLPGAVHEFSSRLKAKSHLLGWDEYSLSFLFLPPLFATIKLIEMLVNGRLRTFVIRLLPKREVCWASLRFALLVLLLLFGLKLFFFVPIKIAVWERQLTSSSKELLSSFEKGGSAFSQGDMKNARLSFLQAKSALLVIDASMGSLTKIVSSIGQHVPILGGALGLPAVSLVVGNEISQATLAFTAGFSAMVRFFGGHPQASVFSEAQGQMKLAHHHAKAALASLNGLDIKHLPGDLRLSFQELQTQLAGIVPVLGSLPDRLRLMHALLAGERFTRYLIVFQNNAELRPAGGFAGSFALVDVDRGKLKRIEIPGGGSYDLQGGLSLRVAAPEPLKRFRPRWEFQDTNWFSDWPSSARTMMAFYENAGGPTVDGALMLTTSALEELLGVLGPLDIPEQRMQLTKENAFTTIQSVVESKAARRSKRPKAVLGSIVTALMKRVFAISPAEVERLLPVFEDLIRARHIAIYLKDEQQQQAVLASGLAAEVRENPSGDYFAFVAANIGGGKSDREIEDTIDLATTVRQDGHIERTLRLTRAHHGRPGAPFVGVTNISYLRFYVPSGATLLSAQGFSSEARLAADRHQEEGEEDLASHPLVQERPGVGTVDPESRVRITEEFGKTVFGNWLIVQPGQTADIELRYQLPFSFPLIDEVARYTLLVQKQPGTRAQNVNFNFALPSGWSVLQAAPESLAYEGAKSVPLNQDRVFALLFTRS